MEKKAQMGAEIEEVKNSDRSSRKVRLRGALCKKSPTESLRKSGIL